MSAASSVSGASSIVATMRKLPSGSGAITTIPSREKSSETSSRPSGQRMRTSARMKDSASASPFERDAGGLSHEAAHAVAGHDIACGDRLLAGGRGDGDAGAGGTLRDSGGRDAAVDGAAERRKPVGEHALGDVLRQHQHEIVGRGQLVQLELQQRPVAIAEREALDLEAAAEHLADDAQRLEHLERVGVDHRGAGGVLPVGQPVDQKMVDAGLAQDDCEREAGRTGADDQDVGGGGKHSGDSFLSTVVDLLRRGDCICQHPLINGATMNEWCTRNPENRIGRGRRS